MNKKKVNNKYYIQTKLIAVAGDPKDFEKQINEFAKTHTVIGIKYQSFLVEDNYYNEEGQLVGGYVCDRALIMYKVRVDGEEVEE